MHQRVGSALEAQDAWTALLQDRTVSLLRALRLRSGATHGQEVGGRALGRVCVPCSGHAPAGGTALLPSPPSASPSPSQPQGVGVSMVCMGAPGLCHARGALCVGAPCLP